jgi:hypothetical protein
MAPSCRDLLAQELPRQAEAGHLVGEEGQALAGMAAEEAVEQAAALPVAAAAEQVTAAAPLAAAAADAPPRTAAAQGGTSGAAAAASLALRAANRPRMLELAMQQSVGSRSGLLPKPKLSAEEARARRESRTLAAASAQVSGEAEDGDD